MSVLLSLSLLGVCVCLAYGQSPATSAPWPSQTFKTEPSFHPPVLQKTRGTGTPAAGYLVFSPSLGAPEVAPLIMTDDGQLVWHGPNGNATVQTLGLTAAEYRNETVLAYWVGTVLGEPFGMGYGSVVLLNIDYEVVATVTLAGNFGTVDGSRYQSNVDFHEIFITHRGTILVTAHNVTQTDLASVGGPRNGWVVDSQFYEIDIETNDVLFSWSSLNHSKTGVPFELSTLEIGSDGLDAQNPSTAWGYFTINSVAPYNAGYLVSSRYMCSAFYVNPQGDVLWRLGGIDGGDFTQSPDASFCWQHDIRPVYPSSNSYSLPRNATVHLFDDANCEFNADKVPSSGLLLDLDTDQMRVSVNRRYSGSSSAPLKSMAEGSYQDLSPGAVGEGNVIIGYGSIPFIRDFSSDGVVVQTIQFGNASIIMNSSYRSFKQLWVGCPTTKPAVSVQDISSSGQDRVDVYMSWNGATDVESWRIYAVAQNSSTSLIGEGPKVDFETRIRVPKPARLRVEAVLKRNSECGMMKAELFSDVVDVD